MKSGADCRLRSSFLRATSPNRDIFQNFQPFSHLFDRLKLSKHCWSESASICNLSFEFILILIEYLLTFASHSAFPSPSPLICPHSIIRLQSCFAFLHCVLSFACARTFTINLSPPLFSASRTVCSALRFLPICLVYCLSLNNPTILCMIHWPQQCLNCPLTTFNLSAVSPMPSLSLSLSFGNILTNDYLKFRANF